MKRALFGPALLVVALGAALGANAQSTAAPPPVAPAASADPVPVAASAAPLPSRAGAGSILPGSLSGAGGRSPAPGGPATAPRAAPVFLATTAPAPSPSGSAPGRFHLHRPGTDVDGDLLSGNAASDIYVFRGNVVLHSDPKIDHEFGGATESEEPITVTADEIDVDRIGLSYVAKGHVHFTQGARSGSADVAMLNEQTRNLDLVGNADVMQGDHRARAAKMHYNIADRTFHGAGDVRIYQPAPTPAPRPSATAAPKHRRRFPL